MAKKSYSSLALKIVLLYSEQVLCNIISFKQERVININ